MSLVHSNVNADVKDPLEPQDKMPYRPQWVTRLTKGRVLKYKRREFSSPVFHEDKIYVGSDGGYFYSLKTSNGKKMWRFKAYGSVNSTAAVGVAGSDVQVIFGDDKGFVYSLSASQGSKNWETQLTSEVISQPAVSGSKIFVQTLEGSVVALESATGKILWSKDFESPQGLEMTIRGNSSPAVSEKNPDTLYTGFWDGTLRALSTRDGKVLWEKKLGSPKGFSDIDATPLIEGDFVYTATFDGDIYCLQKKSGAVVWNMNAKIGSGVKILSEGENLFVSGSEGHLIAIHKKTGKLVWKQEVGKGALTSPVVFEKMVAVGLSDSSMTFLSKNDGHILARRFAKKGIFSDPILVGDRLYYLSNGGRVYSLRLLKNP